MRVGIGTNHSQEVRYIFLYSNRRRIKEYSFYDDFAYTKARDESNRINRLSEKQFRLEFPEEFL